MHWVALVMRHPIFRFLAGVLLAATLATGAACGSVQSDDDDGPAPDAAGVPDGGPEDDAARPDATPITPPSAAAELNAAAGRAAGGGYTLEFQVGHTIPQFPASGGGRTLEPDTAIKP